MPAIQDMGDVFIASTSLPIRQYIRQAFRGGLELYDRIVLPMVGRFQLAEMAVDAGWRCGEIQCADMNVFSSLLGYMAAGKDIAELEIEFPGDTPEAEWARAKFEQGNHAAAVCLIIKLAQFKLPATMDRLVRSELWAQRDRYGHQFQANAQRLAEKLRGLDYEVRDVFEVVDGAIADERALVYVDPGRRVSGDPFACVGEQGNAQSLITWKAPVIAPFDPKAGMDKLHHDLMPANALAFFHWGNVVPDVYKERSVYVVERGTDAREHILCNRPDEARRLVKARVKTDLEAATIPVLPANHTLTTSSKVSVSPVGKASALYYADLWGSTIKGRVGQCFFILLDGHIAGVVGMNFADIRQSRGPWVTLLWQATPPHVSGRLDSIVAHILMTEDTRRLFESEANAPLYDVEACKTLYLGLSPDCPTYGQLFAPHMRERDNDGVCKVLYVGTFSTQNWASCIANVLEKSSESAHKSHGESGANP